MLEVVCKRFFTRPAPISLRKRNFQINWNNTCHASSLDAQLRGFFMPNGLLWDLVLTGKESKEGREEVLEIEKVLKKRKVVKK